MSWEELLFIQIKEEFVVVQDDLFVVEILLFFIIFELDLLLVLVVVDSMEVIDIDNYFFQSEFME